MSNLAISGPSQEEYMDSRAQIEELKKKIISLEDSLAERYLEIAILTDKLKSSANYNLDLHILQNVWLAGFYHKKIPFQLLVKYKIHPKNKDTQKKIIRDSGLFDVNWYLSNYPEARNHVDGPVNHYLEKGANEAKDPSILFKTSAYKARHPGVDFSKINPLIHYLLYSRPKGEFPW